MPFKIFITSFLAWMLLAGCAKSRIHEQKDWNETFKKYQVQNGAFVVRDHIHDAVYFNDQASIIQRKSPASTFKIVNSLVALEEAVVQDDATLLKWDGQQRSRSEWNKDLSLREAFKASCVPCYQEIARKIGTEKMQRALDTLRYGNKKIGGAVDQFWLDNSLQVSADEQVGLMRRLYFNELPFSDRNQRIVRSLMLQEETPTHKLYYKTGTSTYGDTSLLWVVGFTEKMVRMKEHENSMNKSDQRTLPYFFALNYTTTDTSEAIYTQRIEVLKDLLHQADAW